jgi:flavin-dependent dehydrogenase
MTDPDVVVVGAGPAGAVAALVLARAGARVRLLDRARFPRDKLCGDSVNPGALAVLRRLGVSAPVEALGLPVAGMRLTGPSGADVSARYPDGLLGRAILRRDLDRLLVDAAVGAGAVFEPGVKVERAIVESHAGRSLVRGVAIAGPGAGRSLRARAVVAADGRRSSVAFGLGLARHPRAPRRWAIGCYYVGVAGVGDFGEMHVRPGRYIGVAAVPGGLSNVCVVRPWRPGDRAFGDPRALVAGELARDPLLRERFADARLEVPPVVLGPLAVEPAAPAPDGLLTAGDAAGFIDPMTGDGLRFAVRGGELAALAALEALEHGWSGVHVRHARRRAIEFGAKARLNRALRALVASPAALGTAAAAARLAPAVFRALIAYAGDCHLASPGIDQRC